MVSFFVSKRKTLQLTGGAIKHFRWLVNFAIKIFIKWTQLTVILHVNAIF